MTTLSYDDDPNINSQLTEKFLIKSQYIFHLDGTNKKLDHIIDHALTNTEAYEPFFNKFNQFALTFNFFTPNERDIHCSPEVMLKMNLTQMYTYYKSIQRHFIHSCPTRNPHHRYMFINSKFKSPYFLNFTYCIKSTNVHGIFRNYDPIRQM